MCIRKRKREKEDMTLKNTSFIIISFTFGRNLLTDLVNHVQEDHFSLYLNSQLAYLSSHYRTMEDIFLLLLLRAFSSSVLSCLSVIPSDMCKKSVYLLHQLSGRKKGNNGKLF